MHAKKYPQMHIRHTLTHTRFTFLLMLLHTAISSAPQIHKAHTHLYALPFCC